MIGRNSRWLGSALLAGTGAGLLSLTSMMNSAFAFGTTLVGPDPVIPFEVMGGSGVPIPPQSYMDNVSALYLPANADVHGLVTPEGFYPLTGVNSLPLDTSVSQSLTILNDAIAPNDTVSGSVGVFGASQSAVIASLEMDKLEQEGLGGAPVQFVLVGDLMNPNGGIFERFAGLDLPSLGINFYGATPAGDFPTTIYTLEYDGYADFPRYPIDILSDLNAVEGMTTIHPTYADLTTTQLETAKELMTTGGLTTYYIIPTNNLPLLDSVRDIPVIGNPIADLVQPDMTYLVDLGYGDPLYGWSTTPANVATPFGLFPPLNDFEQLAGLLASGTAQGIENFIGDLSGNGPNPVTLVLPSLSSLTSLLDPSSGAASPSALADPFAALSAAASDPALSLTEFANALSSAAATSYGALLPTTDIANALLTSIPAYDASLFLDNLGDPINAIGLPIAADVGLGTVLAGVESAVIGDAITTTVGILADALIP